MIDVVALWIGRTVLLLGGIGVVLFVATLAIDSIWKWIRYRAYFIDVMAIYMRSGRSAAKARAANLPRQPYP